MDYKDGTAYYAVLQADKAPLQQTDRGRKAVAIAQKSELLESSVSQRGRSRDSVTFEYYLSDLYIGKLMYNFNCTNANDRPT